MKKIAGFLSLIVVLCFAGNKIRAQEAQDYGKSMALILRVAGVNKLMEEITVYKSNVFSGRAKNINTRGSVHSTTVLHVQIYTSDKVLLLDAFVDNPLDLILESFNPDGSIERTDLEKEEGFVNLKFPLPAAATTIMIHCYQYNNDNTERFISTLEMSYDAK